MANILLASEAARVLRCDADDELMLDLLPLVDAYLETATGRAWQNDTAIRAEAKSAARMLLTLWFENPAMIAMNMGSLAFGLPAALAQLEAVALTLETVGVPDEELALRASMPADGAIGVALDSAIVVIFNHDLGSAPSTGAGNELRLEDANGNQVAFTAALDVTGKILTATPSASLSASSVYELVLDGVPDVYGMTVDETVKFWTTD